MERGALVFESAMVLKPPSELNHHIKSLIGQGESCRRDALWPGPVMLYLSFSLLPPFYKVKLVLIALLCLMFLACASFIEVDHLWRQWTQIAQTTTQP